jgi:hypothetical protein
MDVLGANRLRRVVCSKRYCGFSTRARNGTRTCRHPNDGGSVRAFVPARRRHRRACSRRTRFHDLEVTLGIF